MIKKIFISLFLATIPLSLLAGFAGDTAVAIPTSKFNPIKDLKEYDSVWGLNKKYEIQLAYINNCLEKKDEEYVELIIGEQTLLVARSQTFLNFITKKWVKAKNLKVGDKVCTAKKPGYLKVKNVLDKGFRKDLYDIRLQDIHMFCVTPDFIIVHNMNIFQIFAASLSFTLLFDSFAAIATTATAIISFEVAIPLLCVYAAIQLTDNKPAQSTIGLNVAGAQHEKHFEHENNLNEYEQMMLCEYQYDPNRIGSTLPCNTSKNYPSQPTPPANCIPSTQSPTPNQTCNSSNPTVMHDGDFGCHANIDSDHQNKKCLNVALVINGDNLMQPQSYSMNTQPELNRFADSNRLTEQASNSKKEDEPRQTHSYPESQHEPGKKCDSDTCNPPAKGPNGYYIPSDKHKSKPNGNASAGPATWEEGQKALDNSVPVIDKNKKIQKQRITVYDGKFLIFEPTLNDVWHGHYRPWAELDQNMKNTLEIVGLVKNKNGKL